MTRTLYLTGTMGAEEWSVYLADPDDPALKPDNDDEHPCEGITLYAERVILINRSLPRTAWAGVLMHELTHAGLRTSGAKSALRLSEPREELICDAQGSAVAQFLLTSKALRMPRGAK